MVEDQNIVRGRNGPYHCLVHMWELNDVDVRNGPCHICVSLCVYASGVCVCCVWIHVHAHMYPYICMPTVYECIWVCIRCYSTLFTGTGGPMFSNRPMWITLRVHESKFPTHPPTHLQFCSLLMT